MHAHHHSHHGHSHTHGHAQNNAKKIWFATAILLGYAVLEAIAGWYSGSLALLSDAGHMATDVFSLGLAGVALWYMQKPATQKHSYGTARAEVIAALINGLLNIIIVLPILWEAMQRFYHPTAVNGLIVSAVSVVALFVTASAAFLLNSTEKSLNTHAAMLHLFGDMLASLAALVTGLVIHFTGWTLIDPILSVFICVLIVISTLQLLRETFIILMEGVPMHVNLAEVGQNMAACQHVESVHDLHIWTLASGVVILSAHIVLKDMTLWAEVFKEVQALLKTQYGITHVTLQPEIITPEPVVINLIKE